MKQQILQPVGRSLAQHCLSPLLSSMAMVTLLSGVGINATAKAQQVLECNVISQEQGTLQNQVQFDYQSSLGDSQQDFQGLSNVITTNVVVNQVRVEAKPRGVYDQQGNRIIGLGTVVDSFDSLLSSTNLSQKQVEAVSLVAAQEIRGLGETNSVKGSIEQLKTAMAESLSEASLKQEITALDDAKIALIILGLGSNTLQAMGLPETARSQLLPTGEDIVRPLITQMSLREAATELEAALSNLLTESDRALFEAGRTIWNDTVNALRENSDTANFQPGETLTFSFTLTNEGKAQTTFTLPPLSTWQAEAMTGTGNIKSLSYGVLNQPQRRINTDQEKITISPGATIEVTAEVTLGEEETTTPRQIKLGLGADANCGNTNFVQQTITVLPPRSELGDPFGRVTGCKGELLPDYRGFTVGLYESLGGSAIGAVIPLTRTELPDNPNNNIPAGLEPNIENSNPFFLTNEDGGRYNFLFDVSRGQLDEGATYILLVNPPEDSIYDERRIRIVIGQRSADRIPFSATSLDGQPISVTDPLERTIIEGTFVVVEDAERLGLNLAVIDFQASTCQGEEVDIDKFADRNAADVGDIVLYQLSIRNLSQDPVDSLTVTDRLPAGFNLVTESVRGGIRGEEIDLEVDHEQRNLEFQFVSPPVLPSEETLKIIYGAEVTPDAMRGSGINTASVEAQILDRIARDGPVTQEVEIRPGILNDCGTVVGRVFVDQNFDGEQQSGEVGVPNAVIYLEDGNRITTDSNGLYSLKNVCPGYHTSILDLTSILGYQIAPNPNRREKRSPSRLFQMSPGAMVRINFAVTPTAEGGEQ